MRSRLAALVLLAACRRPAPAPVADAGAPPPPSPTAPLAVADPTDAGTGCARDDSTHTPLPKSTLPDVLDPAHALGELRALNELCGDTWCEGSFEYYFHGLRCDAASATCDLDMRLYTHLPVPPAANVVGLARTDPHFRGVVLGQKQHARCTPPCWGKGEIDPPCETFDVRCTISTRGLHAEIDDNDWMTRVSECISAMEPAIRARVPEFAPRDR